MIIDSSQDGREVDREFERGRGDRKIKGRHEAAKSNYANERFDVGENRAGAVRRSADPANAAIRFQGEIWSVEISN